MCPTRSEPETTNGKGDMRENPASTDGDVEGAINADNNRAIVRGVENSSDDGGENAENAESSDSADERSDCEKRTMGVMTASSATTAVLSGSNLEDDATRTIATKTEQSRQTNPYKEASFFSRLFFLWPYPLLRLGMKRPLNSEDLPEIMEEDRSSLLRTHLLERVWEGERKRNPENPKLHWAIVRDFLVSLWYVQPIMFCSFTAKVLQAVAFGNLIESFATSGEDDKGYERYFWATLLVACASVVLFEHHHNFLFKWHKGMQLRIAAVSAIYEKSLRLSSTHQDMSTSSGKIMNLASNDVERLLIASLFLSHLFWAPVQSFAVLGVGISVLGPAFAAGIALMLIVVVPLQSWLSKRFALLRSKIAAITDRRVNLVSQAVHGARVMKMNGWEWQFLDRIAALRKLEIAQIAKATTLKACNEALFFSANVAISTVIFLVHVAIGGTLTPRNVFTVMTLVNVVQIEMTKHLSLGVMGVSECFVSLRRLQNFLEFPELATSREEDGRKTEASKGAGTTKLVETKEQEESGGGGGNDNDKVAISVRDVWCNWNEVSYVDGRRRESGSSGASTDDDSHDGTMFPALSDVSLNIGKGELVCVIGGVGSGKSALIQMLVGELMPSKGTIRRHHLRLSYAAQDAWLMDGTVQENVLMGLDYELGWYDEVVRACGLNVDFGQLRHGDQTVVGTKGVQLSGGQRARIGLARALYRDADILVTDDCLSAVDAKVGRQIFFQALLGLAVNRGKCVVLATHQHQFVTDSRCVLMVNGSIKCDGSYSDCIKAAEGKILVNAFNSSVDEIADDSESTPANNSEQPAAMGHDNSKEIESTKEASTTGLVKFETFMAYLKAMGGVWLGGVLVLIFSVTQASVLVAIAIMGKWAERPVEDQRSWDIIAWVIGAIVSVIVLALFRAILSFRLTIRASRRLHDDMAKAVLRAKIEFFDTNPLGRILNRFSADVGSNDDLLPNTLFDFSMIFFIVLGAIVTTVVVLPFTLVAIPPLLWYFLSVRRTFVTTTRELKRLEGLARSPIFAMMSESLSGIATIRANDSLDYFRRKFEDAHNAHSRAFFSFIASSRWVGFRMDTIMFLFLVLTTYMAVLFHQEQWFDVDPAVLGLALSMLLQLAGVFQWCLRQSAEVINQMVSVERVAAFSELPSEAALSEDGDEDLTNWPRTGTMNIRNLSARYREGLPLALKNVSFRVPQGRVGVVGRTGSGKSTLVQTLFRLIEAEPNGGRIELDGVDISGVGLHTLRTRLSVIPQTPVLFSGCTVRENLDPFATHTDQEITDVLRDVRMLDVIREMPAGWSSMVSEGGQNFSVGQRQLLCLARAILTKNKFLVLDEPTANVDQKTDQLLQEALHKSFHDATILSVAHRLDTVIDYDNILVLGHGKVLEFGSPQSLLETKGGYFASMVEDTGEAISTELKRRAREASLAASAAARDGGDDGMT